jgi:hypothetical protein
MAGRALRHVKSDGGDEAGAHSDERGGQQDNGRGAAGERDETVHEGHPTLALISWGVGAQ